MENTHTQKYAYASRYAQTRKMINFDEVHTHTHKQNIEGRNSKCTCGEKREANVLSACGIQFKEGKMENKGETTTQPVSLQSKRMERQFDVALAKQH